LGFSPVIFTDSQTGLQRIGAAVPFPGAAVNDDVQASSRRADEEAAALAKAAAEAERKVSCSAS